MEKQGLIATDESVVFVGYRWFLGFVTLSVSSFYYK